MLDFFCAEANLIVEADGGQHADDGEAHALARGARLSSHPLLDQ
jgi:very-short-patch-repair endonuclease